MTGRHTLYGQSLVRSANSMVNLSGGSGTKHWVKSWIKPPKKQNINNINNSYPIHSGVSSGENTTSNSTPQPPPVPVYEFEVHSWVLTEEIEEIKADDESLKDYLDLSQFYFEPREQDKKEQPSFTKTGSLTDADIRGAVGGGDMIGFSSSQAQTMKTEAEAKKEEIKSETESPLVEETPKAESGSEEPKDAEGDVKME